MASDPVRNLGDDVCLPIPAQDGKVVGSPPPTPPHDDFPGVNSLAHFLIPSPLIPITTCVVCAPRREHGLIQSPSNQIAHAAALSETTIMVAVVTPVITASCGPRERTRTTHPHRSPHPRIATLSVRYAASWLLIFFFPPSLPPASCVHTVVTP